MNTLALARGNSILLAARTTKRSDCHAPLPRFDPNCYTLVGGFMNREHTVLSVLSALGISNGRDLSTRTSELLDTLGVWEVAHRLRSLLAERPSEAQAFLEYLTHTYPAAADRIQILLAATKGEDKELLKREFGGD